tara:strand:+ start:82 stop:1113 length:1032 start_codon:yes stop_codon:yes gene_type:complete
MSTNKSQLLIDKNKLRTPNAEEWKNLPLSPQDAKDKGLNVYQDESGEAINMRYKSRAKRGRYVEGIQYEPEKVNKRRSNRGADIRRENEQWSSPQDKTEANKFKKEIKAYNNGANPWNEKLAVDDDRFRRVEHDLKISDPLFKNHPNMPMSSGDRGNLIWTTKSQWKGKDSFEQIYGDKYVASLDRITGDTRYVDREAYDPWQHTHDQGSKLEKDFVKVLPKKVNSKKLFRNLSSVAGQSNNPLVNVGGDLVGAVIDGVSYMGDPSRERAIDVLLSTGQAATSLAAVGLALVPIPGSRFAGFALMKIGDNIGKAERIWNMAREGAMRDTKVKRGGAIDPWKIK